MKNAQQNGRRFFYKSGYHKEEKKMKKILSVIAIVLFASLFANSSVYASQDTDSNVEASAFTDTIDSVNSELLKTDLDKGADFEELITLPVYEAEKLEIVKEIVVEPNEDDFKHSSIEENAAKVSGVTLPEIPAYGTEDIELLAKLIWHESEGEIRDGKIAVGEVVLNRINSELFPDTVYDVIYQQGQFSHVKYVEYEEPDEETYEIANDVLNNGLKVLDNPLILYFRNPMKTSGIPASEVKNWGYHEYATYFGNHAFYIHTYKTYSDVKSSGKKTRIHGSSADEAAEENSEENTTENNTEEFSDITVDAADTAADATVTVPFISDDNQNSGDGANAEPLPDIDNFISIPDTNSSETTIDIPSEFISVTVE